MSKNRYNDKYNGPDKAWSLVMQNYKYACKVARGIVVFSVDFDDIVQTALLGMYDAAKKYLVDNKGVKFTTYSKWHIYNAINSMYSKSRYPVAVPRDVYDELVARRSDPDALRISGSSDNVEDYYNTADSGAICSDAANECKRALGSIKSAHTADAIAFYYGLGEYFECGQQKKYESPTDRTMAARAIKKIGQKLKETKKLSDFI